jgi:hypothetical protein
MNLSLKSVFACAAIGALAACAPDHPAPLGPAVVDDTTQPALTGAQITSLVAGKTATGPISGSHILFKMYVAPDGTATADRPTGIEHGVWHVANDQWCVKWENYRGGREYCQSVYPNGPNYKFVSPTTEELFTFQPGNQLNAPS